MTDKKTTSTPSGIDNTVVLKRSRGLIKRQLTSFENVIASINENTNFATLNL